MSYEFVSFHADLPDDTFYAVQALVLGAVVSVAVTAAAHPRRAAA